MNLSKDQALATVKYAGSFAGHSAHQNQRAFHGFTAGFDQFQRSWYRRIPREIFGHDLEHVALIGGVEVVELVALGFEHGDPR
jgi:hypothetical protein